MAFTPISDGDLAVATQIEQVIDALQGASGAGQPISLTSLESATDPALTVANQGTGGLGLRVESSVGAGLLDVRDAYTSVDAGTLYVDHANNRVGVNQTVPTVALDVVGSVSVTGTVSAGTLSVASNSFGAGLVGTPGLFVTGDTNTGFYAPAADQLAVTTGGVQRALFSSTGLTVPLAASIGTGLTVDTTTLAVDATNDRVSVNTVTFDGTDTTNTVKLKVAGMIRSTSGGVMFPDGSIQTAAAATASSLSSATDVVLAADSDTNGTGDIQFQTRGVLRAKFATVATAGGVLDLADAVTPGSPSASYQRFYFKSDHVPYVKSSAGTEYDVRAVGASANRLFRGTGADTGAWAQIAAGDYAAGSIAAADIAAGAVLKQLATSTLGGDTATVDFSSISGSYSALRISILARTSTAVTEDTLSMRFGTAGSADTGANYFNAHVYGSSAGASGNSTGSNTSAEVGYLVGNNGPVTAASPVIIDIPAYTNATWHKGWAAIGHQRDTATISYGYVFGGTWSNTGTINFIRLFCGGNFKAGSTFTLWGIP